ncbi:MAG: helix-turn-helix domain-containing protein [Chloroflexi bacterium]|nr:helix-turn-helix domain-containing protein [Chloroflexota bacterium]
MRQLTLAEILRLALPPDTRVVAGAANLQRPVHWARVAGTRPLAAGSLEEGELVIFAALPPPVAGEGAQRLVALLDEMRVAGLLVAQPPPQALVEAAERVAMPLLVAPATARPADLERAIVALIVDRRAHLQQRADETYQRLTRIALEDRGLGAIVQALADTMEKLVVIQDEYGVVQEAAAPRTARSDVPLPPLATAVAELQARTRELPWPRREELSAHAPPPQVQLLGDSGLARVVVPIVLKRTMAGFLSAVGPAATCDELDRLVIGPAAIVCALEIAKQRAVAEAEYRLQADVLDAALAGRFASESELASRARTLGYDLSGEHVALAVALDSDAARDRATVEQPRLRLRDALRRVLDERGTPYLLRQEEERVVAFVPASPATARGGRLPEALRQTLAELLDDAAVSLGVGRAYRGVTGLSASYQEAAEALAIGQALLGGSRTTHFADLGIRRLLFPLRGSPELQAFYDEFLGALETYDERHGTELIRTLEGFFAHHGNHVRAAEALHLHRNTLLYRLARIQAIAGLDLDDPEVRLAVQVALRLRPASALRRQPAMAETAPPEPSARAPAPEIGNGARSGGRPARRARERMGAHDQSDQSRAEARSAQPG